MKASEFKREARENLNGKWGKAACITLIYMAISFVVSYVQELLGETSMISNIIKWVYFIINIPLSFGLIVCFMKIKRNEDVSILDLFKEAFARLGKACGITWHTFLKLLLPIIFMLIILGTLICFAFIYFSNSSADILNNSILMTIFNLFNNDVRLILIFSMLLLFIAIIYMIVKSMLYVFAYNISYDNPELSSKECVLKSAELMKGNRWKYFLLGLSFIGWLLLLTFGFPLGTALLVTLLHYFGFLLGYALMIIGMSFLMPYIQVATICFYEKVANKNTEKNKE